MKTNSFLLTASARVSKYHQDHPFVLQHDGQEYRVDYEPAESTTDLFGGNSNWRGPVWFPVNYLLIESLQRYHYYYGDDFTVEFPTGSGQRHEPGRGRSGVVPPARANFSAGPGWPPAGVRRRRSFRTIRTCAITSVLRILPRR